MTSSTDFTREDQLVADEIANAVRGGGTITGDKIVTITGLTRMQVAAALRRLASAGLIRMEFGKAGSH